MFLALIVFSSHVFSNYIENIFELILLNYVMKIVVFEDNFLFCLFGGKEEGLNCFLSLDCFVFKC